MSEAWTEPAEYEVRVRVNQGIFDMQQWIHENKSAFKGRLTFYVVMGTEFNTFYFSNQILATAFRVRWG